MSQVQEVKTGLMALFKLIGSYSFQNIMALMAMSAAGKSTLAIQLAYEFSHLTGKKVLYYDTEGGITDFLFKKQEGGKSWDEVFRARYPKAQSLIVRTRRTYFKILEDHGKKVFEKVSEASGKLDATTIPLKENPVKDLIKKEGIGMVIYDSMTMPFKSIGGTNMQFPARNVLQSAWLDSMMDLMDELGVVVIVNHHVSKNPADPYATEEMAGGSAVRYASKIQVRMVKIEAKGAKTFRRLKLVRHPRIDNFDEKHIPETLMKLDSNLGYIDVTEEDLKQAQKDAKE